MNLNELKKSIFYDNEKFILLHGDTFKLLKKIPHKTFNLIFADPPYFLSGGGVSCQNGRQVSVNKAEWDESKTIKDKLLFHRKWIALCREVLRDDGTIMISATLHSVYAIGVALEMEGFSIINNIIWRKTNPSPNLACRSFTHSTETIIWARKQLTNNKKGKHTFNYQAMKLNNGGKQMKDYWDFETLEPLTFESSTTPKREKTCGRHPTQKPMALLERLILCSTKENDLVLDPFNGSGTTGIVAHKLGRSYVGIDNVLEYLQLTKDRYLLIKKQVSIKHEKNI